MPRSLVAPSLWKSPAVWIFFLTVSCRLLVLNRFSSSPYLLPDGDDMAFYNNWALRIAGGELTDGKAFYGLPGYAYLLAGIYSIVGHQPFVAGLFQVVVEGFTGVVIYCLGCESFAFVRTDSLRSAWHPGKFVGIAAAVGWVLFIPAQAFSVILMPTCWLVLAYWGGVWFLMRRHGDSVWKPWILLGTGIGIVSMLVATILFLWPLVLASIYWSVGVHGAGGLRWARKVAAILVFAAGVFMGASPAWLHNYFVAREPVLLSAHGGLNLWLGNNPVANGYPRIPEGMRASQAGLLEDSVILAEKAAGRNLSRSEVSKYWTGRANQWIEENRGAWRRLMGAKLANFWNAYQFDDLSTIKLMQSDGILLPGLRFGVVAAFGLPGILLVSWMSPRSRWISAAVLLHMAALLPVFITERYRLCAVPGLLILGASLLYGLWKVVESHRWLVGVVVVACIALSAWFVSIPRPDLAFWSLDHYKAGIRALDAKKLDLAFRELSIAYACVPENSEIVFAMGNLRVAQGNTASAKTWYRRVLELNPNHDGAWSNVGLLALEEKRWEIAERAFRNALKLKPMDAVTHFLLARTYLGMGNREAAQKAITDALQLRPNQRQFLDLQREIEAFSQ